MRNLKIVILMLLTQISFASDTNPNITISGKPLYSYLPDYVFLQSDTYIFKLKKAHLSAANKSFFAKKLSTQAGELTFSRSAIEHLWPVNAQASSSEVGDATNQAYKELSDSAKVKSGKLDLVGKNLYSFSDPFLLVQVKNDIFQIRKNRLSPENMEALKPVANGDRLSITVPMDSVDRVWQAVGAEGPALRRPASVEQDSFTKTADKVQIAGTVLLSHSEPVVFIQSKNVMFHVKRSAIQTKNPESLDMPGSHVEISVPISAIEFTWPEKAFKAR